MDKVKAEFDSGCDLMRNSVQAADFESHELTTFIGLAFGVGDFCGSCLAYHIDSCDRSCIATNEWIEA